MTAIISSFRGDYAFLSNFFPCKIVMDGDIYDSLEHAYQAAKTLDDAERSLIRSAKSPVRAKRIAHKVSLRPDWEEIKVDLMKSLLRQKFSSPTLKASLLKTGDAELVEGNSWGDIEWGCVLVGGVWEGKNILGEALMEIRMELSAKHA